MKSTLLLSPESLSTEDGPLMIVESGSSGSPPFFSEELDALNAKIKRGEKLTNQERARRQGLIFNHAGNASGFCVI
jgi:hypothetical protein